MFELWGSTEDPKPDRALFMAFHCSKDCSKEEHCSKDCSKDLFVVSKVILLPGIEGATQRENLREIAEIPEEAWEQDSFIGKLLSNSWLKESFGVLLLYGFETA